MNFVAPDFTPALPEIFVACMACLILIADLFLSDARRHLSYSLSLLTLVGKKPPATIDQTIAGYLDVARLLGKPGNSIRRATSATW